MFDDRELVVEFVNESREHLAQIESQLLGIEEAGADADLALVNEVFRSVHSIKGAAGFMGFATLGKLAHELENVLNLMRNGQLVASSPIIDTLLKAADKLRWMIDHIERSNEADISDHLAALEQIIAGLIESESPATGGRAGAAAGRSAGTAGRGKQSQPAETAAAEPTPPNGRQCAAAADESPPPKSRKPKRSRQPQLHPRRKREPRRPTRASASAWACSTS